MSVAIIRSLYSPDEKAILDQYFNVPAAARAGNADLETALEKIDCGGITQLEWYAPTAPAVAKIVLQAVSGRLPNWAAVYADGRVETSRFAAGPAYHGDAKLAVLPRALFEIDWATSGPGFSWPMAYFVTWLPGYDRFVVTSSSDSPEGNHGFCDLALGHFEGGGAMPAAAVAAAAGEIVRQDWQSQYASWEQAQWECFAGEGLLNWAQVQPLAEAVWNPEGDADEYEAEQGVSR